MYAIQKTVTKTKFLKKIATKNKSYYSEQFKEALVFVRLELGMSSCYGGND